MSTSLDKGLLTSLVPLNGLNPENLHELAGKAIVTQVPAGKLVFKVGESDKQNIYILSGEVELIDPNNQRVLHITGGTDVSKHPICHNQPRSHTCRVLKDAEVLSVDSNLLDIMLTWDQTGTYQVEELDSADDGQEDWMNQILQCKAFHKIPPTNIQSMFLCMETVDYSPGEKIISQDEDGDFFYVIKSGRALVTRSTPTNPKGVKLAELGSGDSFGEEALISDAKRNATITMLTRGSLVRLSKENFINLLNEPILNWIDYPTAHQMSAEEDNTIWLDVRLPSEFENNHVPGAIHMPLIFLRMKYKTLDSSKKLIICCDTGRRSSAAAYLLAERGFDTYVLKDGLNAVPEEDKKIA